MKRLWISGCAGLVFLFTGAIFPAFSDEAGAKKKAAASAKAAKTVPDEGGPPKTAVAVADEGGPPKTAVGVADEGGPPKKARTGAYGALGARKKVVERKAGAVADGGAEKKAEAHTGVMAQKAAKKKSSKSATMDEAGATKKP